MKIGMIGLGKLGLPCAEVISSKFEVTGFDIDSTVFSSSSLILAKNLADAVKNKDLVFVAVPTPHDRRYDGSHPVSNLPLKDFSYAAVKKVLSQIHSYDSRATVVLISTVLPGTVRSELAPLLPQGTLIYNPYFIAMGTVKEDFLNPELLPIGTKDGSPEGTDKLMTLYRSFLEKPPIALGTWEEAEGIKIFYNTFISFKLSFVNMIQDVAERIGHMNVDVVTEALTRSHQRILSPSYMKAGMGDGGPCHPRDNIALRDLATRLDLGYDLFGEIVRSREAQAKNMAAYLASFGKTVCLLGVGFKPNCALLDGSYSLLVAHYLEQMRVKVHLYDPIAGYPEAPREAVVYLLAHPFELWKGNFDFVEQSVVVDPWRTAPEILGCRVEKYGCTR